MTTATVAQVTTKTPGRRWAAITRDLTGYLLGVLVILGGLTVIGASAFTAGYTA